MPIDVQNTWTDTLSFNSLAATEGINLDKRERTFVASDETPIQRSSWWDSYVLIVSHDVGAVDLSRVGEQGSCMFLEDHDSHSESRIGKIISGGIRDRSLQVTARINTLPPGNKYFQEMQDGCEPGKSIRFDPIETELVSEAEYAKGTCVALAVYRLTKWSLLEISTVTIPAIGGVGFSHEGRIHPKVAGGSTRGRYSLSVQQRQLSLYGQHLSKKKLRDLL